MKIKRKNFTLVELLTVIMIIGILMSMAFVGYGKISKSKLKRTAEMQIQAMSTAIDDFYEEKGYWPTEGSSNTISTKTLVDFNYDAVNLTSGILKDPWGNNYVYDNTSPANNTASYDLSSNGEDGAVGGSDDIRNW